MDKQSIGSSKNWKQYFAEFFMLFAAVTLGFFAENLREYQEEKNREIQFLQNIHFDLLRDLKEARTAIDFNIQKQKVGDSVVAELASGDYISNPSNMYFYLKGLQLRKMFEHSSSGFEQLKNAGGLRLIEDKSIIQQILLIENRIAVVSRLQLSMDENNFDYRQKLSRITDAQTVHFMNKNQILAITADHQKSLSRFPRPEKPRPLLIDSYKDINEVVNLAINSINTTRYINVHLDSLIGQMNKLDKEIVDKYMSKID
jgi:hypothetical protein